MGSMTPITHALSWFILSVVDFRIGDRMTVDWSPHVERSVRRLCCHHRPRYWLEDMGAYCWLGQDRTPHLPGLLPELLS
jgi:hypothetical protein